MKSRLLCSNWRLKSNGRSRDGYWTIWTSKRANARMPRCQLAQVSRRFPIMAAVVAGFSGTRFCLTWFLLLARKNGGEDLRGYQPAVFALLG